MIKTSRPRGWPSPPPLALAGAVLAFAVSAAPFPLTAQTPPPTPITTTGAPGQPTATPHAPRPTPPRVIVRVVRPAPEVLAAHRQREGTRPSVPGTQAQKAYLDPQTGRLREPSPEEDQAFSETIRSLFPPPTVDVRPVVHRSGMVSVDLQGAFMSAAVARRNPDGTITQGCVGGDTEISAFFAGKPPPDPRTTAAPQPSAGKEAADVR